MMQDFTDSGRDMRPIELLDNRRCQGLISQLNDFENAVFGPDFACNWQYTRPWVDSGCLFYSAICTEAASHRRQVLSSISVLITTRLQRERLLAGEIPDYELIPWTQAPRSEEPALYFSSVVSEAPHHLTAMYHCLFRAVKAFRDAHGLTFHGAFGIASGTAGCRHMARNGFLELANRRYLSKYQLMIADGDTASTPFWRDLLHPKKK